MTDPYRAGFALRIGAAAIAVLAALCLAAVGSRAALAQTAAAPGSGPGSISGLWQVVNAPNGTVRLTAVRAPTAAGRAPIPYQPWVRKIVQQRLREQAAGHPFATTKTSCLPQGVPDFGAGPFQILETPGQVTVLREEFTFFRTIRIGGTHPTHPSPTYLGDSIGHWHNGDLIVDTVGLSDRTTLMGTVPHTAAMQVVERYHRTGPDTMTVEATIDDPGAFTAPWREVEHVHRISGALEEYFCENNRNVAGTNGQQMILIPRNDP